MSQVCEYCAVDLSGFSRQWIWSHVKLHEEDKQECKKCGQYYQNLQTLKKHDAKVHKDDRYECEECKKLFKDMS